MLKFFIGIVIFTGKDTKMALNLRSKRNKFSVVDKTLNKLIFMMIIILLFFVFVFLILRYTIGNFKTVWYLGDIIGNIVIIINYLIVIIDSH